MFVALEKTAAAGTLMGGSRSSGKLTFTNISALRRWRELSTEPRTLMVRVSGLMNSETLSTRPVKVSAGKARLVNVNSWPGCKCGRSTSVASTLPPRIMAR